MIVGVSLYYFGADLKGRCCKNRVRENESAEDQEVGRKSTLNVADNTEVKHSPSSPVAIQPKRPVAMSNDELDHATSCLEGKPDNSMMNATGKSMLGDKTDHANSTYHSDQRPYSGATSHGTTSNTPIHASRKEEGKLPEINVNKKRIAQEWNENDRQGDQAGDDENIAKVKPKSAKN